MTNEQEWYSDNYPNDPGLDKTKERKGRRGKNQAKKDSH